MCVIICDRIYEKGPYHAKTDLGYSQKTAMGLNFGFFFVKVLATSMTLFLPLSKVLSSNSVRNVKN